MSSRRAVVAASADAGSSNGLDVAGGIGDAHRLGEQRRR
jgi:hypothetical protein